MRGLWDILNAERLRLPLRWLAHNYKVKIVAFLTALFLWFYVVTENTFQYEVEVPIRITNLSPRHALVTKLPERAVLRLEGSGKALIGLMISGDVWLAVDLAGIERSRVWRPRPDDVILGRAGGQVHVLEVVSPESVRVALDVAEERMVPVVPDVEILPAAGYAVVMGPVSDPDSVRVRGARSVVRAIREVRTVRREYSEVSKDIVEDLPLRPLELVAIEPARVRVIARVEKLMEKSFVQIPVDLEHVPPGTRGIVIPPSVGVVVQGGLSRVGKLNREEIRAFVDYRKPVRGRSNEFVVQVSVPSGVRVQSVEPSRVRVMLERVR